MCLSACLPSSLVDCAETDHVRENENGREKGQASENVSVTLQVKETMAGNAEQIHCKLACLLQAGLFVASWLVCCVAQGVPPGYPVT